MGEFSDSLKGSISSAGKWAADLPAHLKNEAFTLGDVAEKVPSAIWKELHDDVRTGFEGHLDRKIACGVSAVIGAAALIAGRRAPAIMSAITESSFMKGSVALGSGAESISILSGTSSLLADGWNANSSAQRDKIADQYSQAAGANLAPIIEATASGGIGAVAADRALAYSPKFNVATFQSLTERRDYLFRSEFNNREKMFNGAGSFELSSEVTLGGTLVDMNALTKEVEHAPMSRVARAFYGDDSNVEVIREISLPHGRVSAPQRGTPWGSGMPTAPEGITDHNHHNLAGILISPEDAMNVNGLNIVRAGDYRGYYVGQKGNLAASLKEGPTVIGSNEPQVFPRLNQLVINDKGKRAFLLQTSEMKLNPETMRWNWRPEPSYVDYHQAKSLLNEIDTSTGGAEKAFASLSKIPSAAHPDDILAITPLQASSTYARRLILAGTRQ